MEPILYAAAAVLAITAVVNLAARSLNLPSPIVLVVAIVNGLEAMPWNQLLLYALAISGVAIVVRFVWVFPATYLPRWLSPRLRRRDPAPRWQTPFVIAFTGIRGVVSLAAALSIPAKDQRTDSSRSPCDRRMPSVDGGTRMRHAILQCWSDRKQRARFHFVQCASVGLQR